MAEHSLSENIQRVIDNLDSIEQVLATKGIDVSNVPVEEYASYMEEGIIDTRDATATADDIIAGTTAYVGGEKIEGNIILTTKELSDDSVIETVYNIGLVSNYLATTPDGYAICTNTTGNVVLINLKTGDKTIYSPSQFGLPAASTAASGVKAIAVCQIPNEYGAYMVSMYVRDGWSNTVTEYFSCSYYKDGELLYKHDSNQATYRTFTLTSDWGRGALVASNTKPNTIACFAARKTNSIAVTMALDLKSHSTAAYTKYDGDYSYNQSIVQTDSKDRVMFFSHQVEGTSRAAICATNSNFTIKSFSNTDTNYRPFFIEKGEQLYAIHNNNFIRINWNESARTITTTTMNTSVFPTTYRAGYANDNLIFITNNNSTGTLYKYTIDDSNGIQLKLLKEYDNLTGFAGAGYQAISYNGGMLYTDNDSHLIKIQLKSSGTVLPDTIIKDDVILYNTDEANVVETNILENKIVYGKTGKIVGTMPNNGELEYTPSVYEQLIPEGYTDGGIIAAVDSSIDENIIPENIKKDVVILGVTGIATGGGDGPITEEEYDRCLSLSEEILQ